MRKSLTLPLAGLLFFISTAFFLPSNTPTENTPPSVFKIMEVTHLWDLLKSNYEPIRERDDTWLDVGLRSKYAMAKNYASIPILEETFGEAVFIRGPHQGDMDFNSTTSFGYYNPRFIRNVKDALATALENPMFGKVAKAVYERHLKSMAHTYLDAYSYLQKNPEMRQSLTSEYLMMVAQPEGTMEGSLQERFRTYAEALEKSPAQADIYEAFTAPAFWIRRNIDGTAGEFIQLLEMTINHFEESK